MSGGQVDASEALARRKRLVIIIAVAVVLGGGLYAFGWWVTERDADHAARIEERLETEVVARWNHQELWDLQAASSVEEWTADPDDETEPAIIEALSTSEESPTWVETSGDELTARYPAGQNCVLLRWEPDGASVSTVDEICSRVSRAG